MANVEVTGLKMNVSASNIADTKRKLEAVKSALTKLKVPDSKVTAITNLAVGVSKFATAVNKIDTSKIDALGTSLKGLATVEIKKASITRVNELGEAFKNLDLKSFNNIDTAKITAFFESIKGLDQVNIKKVTINRINELGEAFKNVDATALGEQAEKLNNALAPLADTMSKISTSAKELGINANFGKSVAKAAEMYDKFEKAASTKGQKKQEPEPEGKTGIEKFREDVKAAAQQFDNIFDSTAIGKAYNALTNFRQAVSMVREEFSKTKAGQMFAEIRARAEKAFQAIKAGAQKAVAALKKIFSVAGTVAKAISKIGFLNPFKGLANSVGRLVSKLKNLSSSLLRIAMYRALRTAIKEITQAVKEGLTNLYYWSQATGGDFAPAMDRLASSALYLKNSFGAMVSPVITYFTPAIEQATNALVEMLNVVNQLLARLTGRATWTRALRYPTQFAEQAGSATKKVKDNIQDFDELHILRTDNGGGGGSSLDYNNMFEETEFSQGLTDWVENFKDALRAGHFYEAGSILANEINTLINRIPWARLGDQLAEKINDMFQFAWGVLHNIDFVNIGASIATFLNHAIDSIDAHTIGQVFARKWTAIVDFLYGFVTTFNFPNLGWRISEFVQGWFDELDGARIGTTISEAIKGALDAAIAFMSNDDMFEAFVTDIADIINNIDWYGIFCRVLTIGTQVLNAIAETINRVLDGGSGASESSSSGLNVDRLYASAPPAIAQRVQAEYNYNVSRGHTGTFGEQIIQSMTDSVVSADTSALIDAIKNVIKAVWRAVKATIGEVIQEGCAELISRIIGDFTAAPYISANGHLYASYQTSSLQDTLERRYSTSSSSGVNTGSRPSPRSSSSSGASSSRTGTSRTNSTRSSSWVDNAERFATTFSALGAVTSVFSKNATRADKTLSAMDRTMKTLNTDTGKFGGTISTVNSGINEFSVESASGINNVKAAFVDLGNKANGEVVSKINASKSAIVTSFNSMKDEATASLSTLTTNVLTSMQNTASTVTAPLQSIKGNIVATFREAGEESARSIGDLSTRMSTAINGLVQSSKGQLEGYKGTWQDLHTATKGVSNTVIDGSERMANAVTDAFNSLLQNLNGFEIDIPNYKFKTRPKTPLGHISIPKLATGGIVSSPTTALIGEAGKEAVIPLENNTEWMNTLADRINGDNGDEVALLREQNDLLRQIAAKNVTISSRDVFNAVRDENSDYITRTGKNALAF